MDPLSAALALATAACWTAALITTARWLRTSKKIRLHRTTRDFTHVRL